MSRDDYISKLFINNEHKLNEEPSGGLWDRLEEKLDAEMPLEQPHSSDQLSRVRGGRPRTTKLPNIMRFAPYMAAASVLILVIAIASVMNLDNGENTAPKVLAQDMTMVEDIVLEEKTQAIVTTEKELKEQFEAEDKAQEEKIITAARNTAPKVAETVETLDDVELKESAESNDVILIEPEVRAKAFEAEDALIEVPVVTADVEKVYTNSNTFAENTTTARQMVKPQEFKYEDDAYGNVYNNRGYGVPPSADPNLGKKLDEIEEQNTAKNSISNQTKRKGSSKSNRRGLRSKKGQNNTNRKKYDIHPRIKMFDWILGKFEDKGSAKGFKSIENWRLINPNTIEGVGVLMKGKDKIFEDKIVITYNSSQNRVFLKMYVDESKKQITYLLTSFDTERIIFEKVDAKNAPNKVIFQRLMDGFITILEQEGGFIEEQQQRYFDNRYNVNNRTASKNLESID